MATVAEVGAHANGNSQINKWVADNTFNPKDLVPTRPTIANDFPQLPHSIQYSQSQAEDASPWLNEYVEFSRKWSPRAHDDFHESVGLWLLSIVAARRICLNLGKPRYTSLYIALAARTSVFAKSTTAEIAQNIISEARLSYLMAPDDATPQAFVRSMTQRLPPDWEDLSPELQNWFKNKIAFAAQRGWFFDEFGQKVSSMMREGGHMADFRGLLRKFDDTPEYYEYETIGRGKDTVYSPYLSLLANLTPADIKPYARRNAALWNDGFWARFAFVTPPLNAERKNGRFPAEERRIPDSLVWPIRDWHERLGVPFVDVVEKDSDGKTKFDLLVTPPKPQICILGPGVYDAYYAYNDALIDIVTKSNLTDLDGNYSRLPEKALRVAMLLASMQRDNQVDMRHWARAQQIAEVWRRNLHNLYEQVVGEAEELKSISEEDRVMSLIATRGPQSTREIVQRIHGMDTERARKITESLQKAGFIQPVKNGRSERFMLIPDHQSVDVDL